MLFGKRSDFCKSLKPIGRILQLPDYYVWCCSPVYDSEGKVHVLFSRWKKETGFLNGWLTNSEIAHAVADSPESEFTVTGTVLKGRGDNHWDAVTIHNPAVYFINGKYYMFYMGNNDGTAATQRIGLAVSERPEGPYKRISDKKPILDVSADKKDWDSYITTNPALLYDEGKYMLYYKAWDRYGDGKRKMGLAVSDRIEGPYEKYSGNPIIKFKGIGKQTEDACVFKYENKYYMLMRDMGIYSQRSGLMMESNDGIHWSKPLIGYEKANHYFHDGRNRFERPQILTKNEKPEYLFLAVQGGKYGTSTGGILKIENWSEQYE